MTIYRIQTPEGNDPQPFKRHVTDEFQEAGGAKIVSMNADIHCRGAQPVFAVKVAGEPSDGQSQILQHYAYR